MPFHPLTSYGCILWGDDDGDVPPRHDATEARAVPGHVRICAGFQPRSALFSPHLPNSCVRPEKRSAPPNGADATIVPAPETVHLPLIQRADRPVGNYLGLQESTASRIEVESRGSCDSPQREAGARGAPEAVRRGRRQPEAGAPHAGASRAEETRRPPRAPCVRKESSVPRRKGCAECPCAGW